MTGLKGSFNLFFIFFFPVFQNTPTKIWYYTIAGRKTRQKGEHQMDTYTIEDIELLRKKSGLSYQEAVALLDYHNGNLARALIDLEKSGRLKEDNTQKEGTQNMSETGKKNDTKDKALGFLQKLYRSRVKIRKGDISIANVSVLFAGLCLLLAPHMTIGGIIVSMILGYQFSFTGMDPDFSTDNLEKMVKNAAQNAKSSVSSVVHTFTEETKNRQTKAADAHIFRKEDKKPEEKTEDHRTELDKASDNLKQQAKEIEETMDSFFNSNPAAVNCHNAYSAATSSVPTIQVPVQTETRDGDIEANDDKDGFSTVTIG